jgi:hypothetical protein
VHLHWKIAEEKIKTHEKYKCDRYMTELVISFVNKKQKLW